MERFPDSVRKGRHAGPALSLLAAAVAAFASQSAMAQVPIFWVPASGLWSNPLKWNPNHVPALPQDQAILAGSGAYTATLDIPGQVVGIDIANAAAILSMNPGTVLAVGSAGLNTGLINDGTLQINGSLPAPFNPPNTALITQLRFPAGAVISGSGTIRLNADPTLLDSAFVSADPGFTWTNSPGHTIAGTGRLYGPASNLGAITADQPGKVLQIAGDITNSGTVSATTGILEIAQGARLAGGSIAIGPSGLLRVPDLAGIASLSLAGNATIAPGARLEIGAGALSGVFDIQVNQSAANSPTALVVIAAATLGNASTSTTSLNANASDLDSASLSSTAGAVSIAPGHTIRGSGRIYAPLSGSPKVNASSAGKTLEILGDVDLSGGGSLSASAAGAVLAFSGNPTITGGTISAIAGAFARVQDFGSPLFKGTTLSSPSTLELRPGSRLRLDAGMANSGTIIVNSIATNTPTGIRLTQSASLTGAGNLTLNANSADLDSALLDGASGVTLTNASGHTIRGTGRVALPITNQGFISANNPNGPLQFRSNLTNSGGSISASNATLQIANGMTLSGGSFTSFGTGRMSVPQGETAFLSSLTLTSGSTAHVMGGGLLQLLTALTNNGSLIVNPAGDLQITRLRANSDTALTGTGSITLNANPSNLDSALIESLKDITLSQASTHSITGQGRIYAQMQNNGLIAAGSAGQFLEILGPVSQSVGGRIRAGAGTLTLRSGAAISGGEFSRTGAGRLTVDGTASASSMRTTCPIDIAAGSAFSLSGFTNDSDITVNTTAGAGLTKLIFPGSQTLLGTGNIILNGQPDIASRARIEGPAAPQLLTLAPTQTLRGSGTVGGNVLLQGTVAPGASPNGTGTIAFDLGPGIGAAVVWDLQLASASAYDSLAMSKPYSLGGALKVTLIGGFNPISTDLFTIVDGSAGATRTGGFDSFNLPTPPVSPLKRKWRLNYLPTDVTLRLTCAADFNGDGLVDDTDFQYFLYAYENLECPTPPSPTYPLQPEPCPADLNEDGVVEDADFVIFAKAYNVLVCQ
ncbi:MAG: hypothetical protein U0573_03885 [Phycisphaerales bacterium]|nr:hypothetical protein [Planctomycetota bacterium]